MNKELFGDNENFLKMSSNDNNRLQMNLIVRKLYASTG